MSRVGALSGGGGGREHQRQEADSPPVLQKPRWEARHVLPDPEGTHGLSLGLGAGSRLAS